MKVSIIVPCYNEEKIILNTYKELKRGIERFTKNYEIIMANDGSTDNTLNILNEIKKKDKKVRVISWKKNRGMGYTHRHLYKAAKGDVIIEMDSDLSIKPTIFKDFLRYIRDYDVVVASRYAGKKGKIPLYRKIPSRIYFLLVRLLFKIRVKDISTGFIAFRKKALKSLRLYSDKWEIHVELLTKLTQRNYRIIEIPAHYVHRTEDEKFNMLVDGPKTFFRMLLLRLRMK